MTADKIDTRQVKKMTESTDNTDEQERKKAEKKVLLDTLLPYSLIVGQEKLKLALELAYIVPRLGGVLISGQRGTAKSTTVRAFAAMMYQNLPVTIPINATEDRVVGGWKIKDLVDGHTRKMPGLLEEANGGLLYVDEINLLDDHIVNIILDVTSTGKLVIQREGLDEQLNISMTLVGTMNPEEGGLRPQLLDRFGLMVEVTTNRDLEVRRQILQTILNFDREYQKEKLGSASKYLDQARSEATKWQQQLKEIRDTVYPQVKLTPEVVEASVRLADRFHVEGHRADYLLALAASAYAAHNRESETTLQGLREVADLVLRHRLTDQSGLTPNEWNTEHEKFLDDEIFKNAK